MNNPRKDAINAKLRELANLLSDSLPDGVGFTLFLFEMGVTPAFVAYISNADRKSMIETVTEWLKTQQD